jgi:hypothetical protein
MESLYLNLIACIKLMSKVVACKQVQLENAEGAAYCHVVTVDLNIWPPNQYAFSLYGLIQREGFG